MLNLLIITTRKKVNRKSSLKFIQRWSGKGDKGKQLVKYSKRTNQPTTHHTAENPTNVPKAAQKVEKKATEAPEAKPTLEDNKTIAEKVNFELNKNRLFPRKSPINPFTKEKKNSKKQRKPMKKNLAGTPTSH